MNFKTFNNNKTLTEAISEINNSDFAILPISENIKNLEYKFFKLDKIQSYLTHSDLELTEVYLIINEDNDPGFKQEMLKIAEKYSASNIRLYENDKSYLISTNTDPEKYPGFGKIGVEIELDSIISEGKLTDLPTRERSLEEGLNLVFPTDNSFY